MERLDYGNSLDIVVEKPSRAKTTGKKRKWREIEAIKEKKRLQKELLDIDYSFKDDIDQYL